MVLCKKSMDYHIVITLRYFSHLAIIETHFFYIFYEGKHFFLKKVFEEKHFFSSSHAINMCHLCLQKDAAVLPSAPLSISPSLCLFLQSAIEQKINKP